jgi:hypothetical protein
MADPVEVLLARVREQLELDGETESEVLAELRSHLMESLREAREMA